MAVKNATKCRASVSLNRRSLGMSHDMCFPHREEDTKIPGSVGDLSGCHIPPEHGSVLGP